MLLIRADQKCTTIKCIWYYQNHTIIITYIWYITYLYNTSINVMQHKNDWPKINQQIPFLPNVVTQISKHFTTYNQSKIQSNQANRWRPCQHLARRQKMGDFMKRKWPCILTLVIWVLINLELNY